MCTVVGLRHRATPGCVFGRRERTQAFWADAPSLQSPASRLAPSLSQESLLYTPKRKAGVAALRPFTGCRFPGVRPVQPVASRLPGLV